MSALDKQIGGNHYKDFEIQPVEFIHRNKLDFLSGNVIKYICRWKAKGGVNDLEKAKHYIELLIELISNKYEEVDQEGAFLKRVLKKMSKEFNENLCCYCNQGIIKWTSAYISYKERCKCKCHEEKKHD